MHVPAKALFIAILAGSAMLLQITPGTAGGWIYHHSRRHHARLSYVRYAQDYGNCQIGWWQTLRYGHVRPRWAVWCQ